MYKVCIFNKELISLVNHPLLFYNLVTKIQLKIRIIITNIDY